MTDLRFTLVSNGPSDNALLPVLEWLLIENGVEYALQPSWADLRHLPFKVRGLNERIKCSIELYPCDLLFVHRDAERSSREDRVAEIERAMEELSDAMATPPHVCVVPVRMTEAWLLFDESAIRRTAGNRSGDIPLELHPLRRLESLPNPKRTLYDLLKKASGLKGRRLKRFNETRCAKRVSYFIDDFSPLRELPAFTALEEEVKRFVQTSA